MSKDLHSVIIGSALAGLLAGVVGCAGEPVAPPKPAEVVAAPAPPPPAPVVAPVEAGQTAANGVALHDCATKNACKGQGGCKTAANGCAGQNACKGQGGCKVDEAKAATMTPPAPAGAPEGKAGKGGKAGKAGKAE